VAQLDGAPDYESGGREFESLRARQIFAFCVPKTGEMSHIWSMPDRRLPACFIAVVYAADEKAALKTTIAQFGIAAPHERHSDCGGSERAGPG
jgi:hypothetical protein